MAAQASTSNPQILATVLRDKMAQARPLVEQHLREHSTCRKMFSNLGHDGENIFEAVHIKAANIVQERTYCRHRTAAFTTIGGSVIYLCRKFSKLSARQAAVVLIHEALHTAGLSEHPFDPKGLASYEINEMVIASCQF